MSTYTDKIRETAQRLLKECKVEMVIGFRKGSQPMMNEPCVVRSPEEVDQLIWDSNCGINLANYLTNRKEKIGIVAKGCDSRNIVTHIVENKIAREQLVIIGVPCLGMIDKRKIAAAADGEILSVTEADGQVMVKTAQATQTFAKSDVLQGNCSVCTHRNPVIHDEMIAEPVPEQTDVDPYADVAEIDAMTPEQRHAFFEELLAPCIRCYACRNACPLCYCPTCFVDESKPQWVGKGQDPADVRTFHFLRAYHCAGRCTDCGACQRACPVGINMRLLTKKLNKDCLELYGWEAGLSTETRPALDDYQPNDPENFIH
ncbi:MAG: 4Fe-4S ferredoxin [Desulfatitalea sp. BRH_c12]|nr:MAG: 4Fe-4S ferredoxin [Desulfatitalea sp. BRH_c12]